MSVENGTSCYLMPSELLGDKYTNFSVESKLLFSMIFTNAEHTSAIKETSRLINSISNKDLYRMRQGILDIEVESGGVNV